MLVNVDDRVEDTLNNMYMPPDEIGGAIQLDDTTISLSHRKGHSSLAEIQQVDKVSTTLSVDDMFKSVHGGV
jgi:hypothetical protein